MSLFLAVFTLTWLAFGVVQTHKRRQRQQEQPHSDLVLPLHLSSELAARPKTAIEGGFFWVTWSTTRFNQWPRRLLISSDVANVLYEAGVLLCLLTTIASYLLLANATFSTPTPWSSVPSESVLSTPSPKALLKRAVADEEDSTLVASGLQLQPLLPGFTTPLEYLPSFLLAMICSGAFHELGHAIPAVLSVQLFLCHSSLCQ